MAQPFQPKFADLVRNYTTTSGTDDFVLGPAVNGFVSVTVACASGDNFYYSAVGVDNPDDTEVGRGTLLDGGVIGRDPISGTKTNFKHGTSAIALVAASEWFAEVDAVRSNGAGPVSVKAFGAKGDSDLDGVSGTDDTAAIQAAINYVAAQGGGTLVIPDGIYKVSSYLTLCANLKVSLSAGATLVATHAGGGGADAGEDLRNGSLFYSNWPSNSSNPAHIDIEGGKVISANSSNVGAAFYDNGGAHIRLASIQMGQFKHCIVLDQSELVDILKCELGPRGGGGGACVWLVNGASLRAGNAGTYTNRISIVRSQINAVPTEYGILDDGGTVHSFVDNNYNGCLNHIRASGVLGLAIRGGEFESASGPPVVLDDEALDGAGVGSCTSVHFQNPTIIPAGTNPCVQIESAGDITFTAPYFGNTTSAKVTGAANAFAIYSIGANNGGGGPTFSGEATNHWEVGNAGGVLAQKTNFELSFTKLDVPGTIRASSSSALTSGSGVELLHNGASGVSGLGSIVAFDRGLGAWQTLQIGASTIRLQAGGSTITTVDSGGIDLTTGKVLKVAGTKVVDEQQPAIADDASASANQATVNAVLAALRAHGLIAAD